MIRKYYGIPKDASWDGFMERFPILFQDKDKPMTQTCMCWGIECPIGWYYILEQLCTILEFHNMEFTKEYGIAVIADQVKEKFGTLRFYFTVRMVDANGTAIGLPGDQESSDPEIDGRLRVASDYLDMIASKYIHEAEVMTAETCADCGTHDDIIETKGWVTYLCAKCCNARREKELEKVNKAVAKKEEETKEAKETKECPES